MGLLDLFITGVALSMDAFAVSVSKGLSVQRVRLKHGLITGAYFGGFQALMPLLGYVLGSRFSGYIERFDHWIAFGLLAIIGVNMIQESFSKAEELNDDFGVKTMLMMAVATSIDALAVGVTFACLEVSILPSSALIGVTTFCLSALGIYIGHIFGLRFKAWAERAGGAILILIGVKILLEHLGIISF